MPMDSIQQISEDNVQVLSQLLTFLTSLDSIQYQNVPTNHGSSMGAHVRHIIEHYQSVLTTNLLIDYDDRKRDQTVQSSRSAATGQIKSLIQSLCSIQSDKSVAVLCTTNPAIAPSQVDSSLARELIFLYSHTTHHMAIIKLLSTSIGLSIDDSFGKAASTRVFESNVQSKLA